MNPKVVQTPPFIPAPVSIALPSRSRKLSSTEKSESEALLGEKEDDVNDDIQTDEERADEEDYDDYVYTNHRNIPKPRHDEKDVFESFDFNDVESVMWRKHQFRRYFQEKGRFWTGSRVSTTWKWILTISTGVLIGATGGLVSILALTLSDWKFSACYRLLKEGNATATFFAFHGFCLFFALVSAGMCWWQPAASGSGIPEIKAFLNGVHVPGVIRMPVLVAKVIGMCFAVGAGLPLGKEGPMIHAGSIIGGIVSQGHIPSIGFDTSWNIFQDLRNDYTKRDYITYGAAAGIAAAFRAPLGGILFALEEGASFWSVNVTIRSFVCAVMTQLTMEIIFPQQATSPAGMFAFGEFENLFDGRSNYYLYELPLFIGLGCIGGVFGAFFNYINLQVSLYRKAHINMNKLSRLKEVCAITLFMAFISFIFSLCWPICTPLSSQVAFTTQQEGLLEELVAFRCPNGYYNQMASLYFTSDDIAMRQLLHFREVDGEGLDSFSSGVLILFFIPYFTMAALTSGMMVPAGLFVPTLLSGAAYGRLIGHWMNMLFPSAVADAGTYALIGAASILGGNARMTIAGTVIVLEACGNLSYLLPLMLTFVACRYTGNSINEAMYDMQIHLKGMPFLETSLHSLGMLNYHPISNIMTSDVVTLSEVEKVGRVMTALHNTTHNGFPVVNRDGKLRGLILRKTLCSLLKYKAYCTPVASSSSVKGGGGGDSRTADGGIALVPASTILHDMIERQYPNFPDINEVKLSDHEMGYWLDLRAHMDASPGMLPENTSIRRTYTLFRTMGLRHIVVVDGELLVKGIITRSDLVEHKLETYWKEEGEAIQNQMSLDTLPMAVAYEIRGNRSGSVSHGGIEGRRRSSSAATWDNFTDIDSIDMEIVLNDQQMSESPNIRIRKAINTNAHE